MPSYVDPIRLRTISRSKRRTASLMFVSSSRSCGRYATATRTCRGGRPRRRETISPLWSPSDCGRCGLPFSFPQVMPRLLPCAPDFLVVTGAIPPIGRFLSFRAHSRVPATAWSPWEQPAPRPSAARAHVCRVPRPPLRGSRLRTLARTRPRSHRACRRGCP